MGINEVGFRLANIVIQKGDLDIPDAGEPTEDTVTTVVTFAFIGGATAAAIVIIIAGINFILSRGDSQKTTNARNAIIYSCVGLGVMALAFTIVRFVVGRI